MHVVNGCQRNKTWPTGLSARMVVDHNGTDVLAISPLSLSCGEGFCKWTQPCDTKDI